MENGNLKYKVNNYNGDFRNLVPLIHLSILCAKNPVAMWVGTSYRARSCSCTYEASATVYTAYLGRHAFSCRIDVGSEQYEQNVQHRYLPLSLLTNIVKKSSISSVDVM